MDKIIRGTAADDTIRVFAACTTDIVREAVRRHQTSPTASVALGRLLTAITLFGGTIKDFDRLSIRIESDGPIAGLTAETDNNGNIRGFVKNPLAELPQLEDGQFDVSGIIGRGNFYVIREAGSKMGQRTEPYIGSVPLVTGGIAEDLTSYLANSEQIPSAVMLGVSLMAEEPFVESAGGILLQAMPGANEHIITMLEDSIAHAPNLSEMVKHGAEPADLAREILGVIDFEVMGEEEIRFQCTCSRERMINTVAALGIDEVTEILKEDKGAVLHCGYCNQEYRLGEADLEKIIEDLKAV